MTVAAIKRPQPSKFPVQNPPQALPAQRSSVVEVLRANPTVWSCLIIFQIDKQQQKSVFSHVTADDAADVGSDVQSASEDEVY
jgi:hypothetical protein